MDQNTLLVMREKKSHSIVTLFELNSGPFQKRFYDRMYITFQ